MVYSSQDKSRQQQQVFQPAIAYEKLRFAKGRGKKQSYFFQEPPRSATSATIFAFARCYGEECPSTRIMFVLAVRCRILRGSRYSSQLSHSLARSADSNSSPMMRFGFHSPSSTSVFPPRTMYLPPYFSTVAAASFLYSSYPTGSTMSISTMMSAGIVSSPSSKASHCYGGGLVLL